MACPFYEKTKQFHQHWQSSATFTKSEMFLQNWAQINAMTLILTWITILVILTLLNILKFPFMLLLRVVLKLLFVFGKVLVIKYSFHGNLLVFPYYSNNDKL